MDSEIVVAIIGAVFGLITTALSIWLARANASQKKSIKVAMAAANEAKGKIIQGVTIYQAYSNFKKPESDGGAALTSAEIAQLLTIGESLGLGSLESIEKVIAAGEED